MKIYLLINLTNLGLAHEKNMGIVSKPDHINARLILNKKLTTITHFVNGIFLLGTLYCMCQLALDKNLSVDADLKYSRCGFLCSLVSLVSALYINRLNKDCEKLAKQIRDLDGIR
ncbi:MAG: hypothetical protein AMXMBFR12_01870 [Candidatus Babeliales bacterium]